MKLLRNLTLAYAAVLVVALAGSLIAILVYLRRIGGVLDEIHTALGSVRDSTAGLEGVIAPLGEVAAAADTALADVDGRLARVDARLAGLGETAATGEARR